MKKEFFKSFIILYFSFIISGCVKESEFAICGNSCYSTRPWTIETLDRAMPCFISKEECEQWARAHGYGGSGCIKCD